MRRNIRPHTANCLALDHPNAAPRPRRRSPARRGLHASSTSRARASCRLSVPEPRLVNLHLDVRVGRAVAAVADPPGVLVLAVLGPQGGWGDSSGTRLSIWKIGSACATR